MTTAREAFEAWANGAGYWSTSDGRYDYPLGRALWRAWQAACAWQRQQGMSALSLRKLDSLIADGYRVNGVAIRRDGPGKIPKQGFITDHGMVGWWPGNEAPDGANKIRSTE